MMQVEAEQNKPIDWLNIGLWLVKFAVLFTSARHVAEAFLSLERAGTHAFWGWLPALATDGGLLFMAWKLKSDSKSKVLWGGFIWFLVMSAFAQIDHAIQNVNFTGDNLYDGWQVVKIGLFAFSLPFLVAFMVVVASKRQIETTESQPQPSTALSTARQSEPSSDPNVSVDKPSTPLSTPRQSNRLKAAKRRALPFQPDLTIPVLKRGNHQLEPSIAPSIDRKNVNSEGVEASSANHQVIRPTMVDVEDEELQKSIDIVRLFRLNNNLSETARQYGFTVEGVRVRIKNLWKDPKQQTWVEAQIPDWVEKNRHKFLAD